MDKVLIELYVPSMDKEYDMWLPIHRRISNIMNLMLKSLNEINDGNLVTSDIPRLYNKETSKFYNEDTFLRDTDIKNGTKLILI